MAIAEYDPAMPSTSRRAVMAPGLALLLVCTLAAATRAAPTPVEPADRTAALSIVGRRLALVVGTGHYRDVAWAPLPNAKTDAEALVHELDRRYGFEVTWLEAPDAATFKKELRRLSEAAGPTDDLLVFVAGHGHFDEVDNAGYLVLEDAAADCERGCYAFDNLKRSLFGTRARHVLVMLDVCYGGTFDLRVALGGGAPDRSRSDPDALRRLLAEYAQYPSRLVFASVGRAAASDGPSGYHSPFMASLLLALSRPGQNGVVSLDRLFMSVQDAHPAQPVQRPTAFEASQPHHPNGTFLFIEDIDFCDAARTLTGAAADQFRPLELDVLQSTPWVTSRASSWVVPGTSECRIWRWEDGGATQLRCEAGRFDPETAAFRSDALFQRLRGCLVAPDWQPAERERRHGDTLHHDLLLTSASRRVTVSRTCGADCGVSVVFE